MTNAAIVRIAAWDVPFDYAVQSRARAASPTAPLRDIVVRVEAADGTVGFGESCALAPTYLPMLAGGTLAALDVLAPALLGRDARGLWALNDAMDAAALGFPDARAALDMACCDLAARLADAPLHQLLGGRQADDALLYRSIPHDEPAAMVTTVEARRAEGYRHFQVKVGGEPGADIERLEAVLTALEPGERTYADANRGWIPVEALQVAGAMAGRNVIIEQPCATLAECAVVRRATSLPVMLDECIDDVGALMRAAADGQLDVQVIKLTHFGGVTRSLEMARACIRLGLAFRIEDTVGGDLSNAAVAHLAAALPPRHLLSAYSVPDLGIGLGPTQTVVENGRVRVSDAPGLGVAVDEERLGQPVADWTR